MNNKYFTILTIILTILLLGSIFIFNYTIDPIRIKNNVTTRAQKYNDLMKYRPNTIMLGGSRIQFLSSYDIKYYTNDIVYNISMTNMTLYEQLKYVEFALKEFNIKNIIIGLNFYTFGKKAKQYEKGFDETLLEKGITFQYLIDIMKTYLTLDITKQSIDIFFNKEKYIKNRMFDKYGSRTLFMQNKVIGKRSWKKRAAATKKSYNKTFDNFIFSDKKMSYYKEIVHLCKENNIKLKVFTTPIHSYLYEISINHATFQVMRKWKKDLAHIHDYYDFMYPNVITKNSNNYIDISHIKQQYGKIIFARLFNDKNINIPNDFGKFITKDNVDGHLKNIKSH